MFDLEREVAAWSEAVYADDCRGAVSAAELKDHLYCEIDRARAEGLSDEQAFAAAVARLGPAPKLASEHAKNRSLLKAVCAAVTRDERRVPSDQRWLLVAHAILWAALVIATSLVLSKTATREASEWMLIVVLIPCWLASEQILKRALRRRPTGGTR
jgi:hypothetical protein